MPLKLGLVLPKKDDDDSIVGKEVDDIVEAMAANVVTFPSPTPPLADVTALNTLFKDSIPSSRNSSIALEELKMKRKEEMLKALGKLGQYILMIANGDRDIAALSGCKLSKATSEKTPQGTPVVKSKQAGAEPDTCRISLSDKAGNSVFLVYLKVAVGEYRLVDSFHNARSIVSNLPSGEQTIHIVGRQGNSYSPATGDFTVRVF